MISNTIHSVDASNLSGARMRIIVVVFFLNTHAQPVKHQVGISIVYGFEREMD